MAFHPRHITHHRVIFPQSHRHPTTRNPSSVNHFRPPHHHRPFHDIVQSPQLRGTREILVRHHSPMCDFISIAVPKKATDAASKRRGRYYAFLPHDNPTLKTQLPADYSAWVLTKGGCSCELCVSIGSVPRKASATLDVVLRDDATEILQEIVAGLDRVFVYVHHYRGDISTEQLPVISRERRKIEAFGAQTPFPRDSLIELTRR